MSNRKKSAQNFNSFFENISEQMLLKESDRGCVLVGAAILDDCLEIALRKVFSLKEVVKKSIEPLFAVTRPLSSLWAKIHLTHALGLISDETYEDLEIIRMIRNEFAHQHKPVDFLNPDVKTLVERFNCIKKIPMKIPRYSFKDKDASSFKRPSDHVLQEGGIIKYHKALFAFAVDLIRLSLLESLSKQ